MVKTVKAEQEIRERGIIITSVGIMVNADKSMA